MSYALNIYIARSNLVSLSSLDAHLMGQVQVRNEVFVSSTLHLPLLFFLRHECHSCISFFLGGCSAILQALSHGLWVDGRVRE